MSTSTTQSKNHYYPDGDIILIVESVEFCVHKTVLSLASSVFKKMFMDLEPSSFSDEGIPEVILENETAQAFENVLSFIYPSVYIAFNWDNIIEVFKVSEKFKMNIVFVSAKLFLVEKIRERPLLGLLLSERYGFKDTFKEASKLVLDDFINFKNDPIIQELSFQTALALFTRHHDYVVALCLLNENQLKMFDDNYCGAYEEHDMLIKKLKKRTKYDVPAPSEMYNILLQSHNFLMEFFKEHISIKIKELFGKFEPLEAEKKNKNSKHYIFIEL